MSVANQLNRVAMYHCGNTQHPVSVVNSPVQKSLDY